MIRLKHAITMTLLGFMLPLTMTSGLLLSCNNSSAETAAAHTKNSRATHNIVVGYRGAAAPVGFQTRSIDELLQTIADSSALVCAMGSQVVLKSERSVLDAVVGAYRPTTAGARRQISDTALGITIVRNDGARLFIAQEGDTIVIDNNVATFVLSTNLNEEELRQTVLNLRNVE